jgi:hypothetical protein
MNKQSLTIFSILFSAALLVLIFFQVYWIRNDFKIKEEVFEQKVDEALNNTSIKLERLDTVSIYKRTKVTRQGIKLNNSILNPNNPNSNNQSFINLNFINDRIPTYYFNKTNLNVNLITKLDLNGVKVIENNLTGQTPTSIVLNPSSGIPYYNNYNIDPDGVLFGNTTCGINNYEKFMVYKSPYISNTSNHIDSI